MTIVRAMTARQLFLIVFGLAVLSALPLVLSPSLVNAAIKMLIAALFALAFSLAMGQAGMLSFADQSNGRHDSNGLRCEIADLAENDDMGRRDHIPEISRMRRRNDLVIDPHLLQAVEQPPLPDRMLV